MTKAIHLELLDFIGAKAFVGVMAHGKDALSSSTLEIMGLAYTAIAKDHGKGAPYVQALEARAAIKESGDSALAQGLNTQGEKGLKLAARKVYESVFASAGLPTTGLFTSAIKTLRSSAPAGPRFAPGQQHVADKVYTVLSELLGLDTSAIAPTNFLVQDLGADSLDLVEITMGVEYELNIEISDEDANQVRTVQDAIDLATRMLSEKKKTSRSA